MLIAFAIAFVVDRLRDRRAPPGWPSRVTETTVSRAAKTRLRMVRRLVFVAIILDRRWASR